MSFLIIQSDQERRDVSAINGGPARMPAVERLASGGVVFDYAFTPIPVRAIALLVGMLMIAGAVPAGTVHVTDIKAEHRHGQTFVTWTDAAPGKAGSTYRYSLYRSDAPITQENLAKTERCYPGVLNNSAKLFGHAFTMKGRLDPDTPMTILAEGGVPLPPWSGLAVRTSPRDGKSFYAVMVTDASYLPVGRIVPGESATTIGVEEKLAPIQPIRVGRLEKAPGGRTGLPMHFWLHGSQRDGGTAPETGDHYIYFGTSDMGWRDGMPGAFSVSENMAGIKLTPRDAIEDPRGDGALQSWWFGYYCVPVGALHKEPRAYPFTENRLAWMAEWAVRRYQADPERVYCGGQSMGGSGSAHWAFRKPDLFAAVYPRIGRVRPKRIAAIGFDLPEEVSMDKIKPSIRMFDDKSDYASARDMVKWASELHADLPFYGLACGRNDNMIPWGDNAAMARALAAGRHGFGMAWNDGGHSSQTAMEAATRLEKYFGPVKFARNRSYPAFSNSSIDDKLGNGDPKDGDLKGGINLGFIWSGVVDEDGKWSVQLVNDLCKAEMTVDVTPRKCQKFKVKAGDKLQWTNSAGGSGEVVAGPWGLVTVERVIVRPGATTTLAITIRRAS